MHRVGIKGRLRRDMGWRQLTLVRHDAGQVNDRRVQDVLPCFLGAQLVPNRLLDLWGHTPDMNELRADFRIVTPKTRLLDFRQ